MSLTDFGAEMKTIWSDRTLAAFDTKAVFAAVTNQEYSGDAQKGRTVIINTLGDISLLDYDVAITNGTMTSSDFSITSQSLAIDQWKYFNKRVDNLSDLWGSPQTFDKLVNRGADSFVSVIDSYLASLHTGFTYSGSFGTDTGSAYVYDQVANMATALMNNGVPVHEGECFVIVPPEAATAMAKDARFTNHITYLQNGIVDGGKVNNLQVYVSANAPASASGHWYIAGHKSAWALAKAIDGVRVIDNPNMFGKLFQGELVYGAKIINQKGLYKLGVKIV